MTITVIHPSRNRAKQAFETATRWLLSAAGNFEYILSLDSDDVQLYLYSSKQSETLSNRDIKIIINENKSAIEAINKAAEIATGDLLIVISDDFDCCLMWDRQLLNELSNRWIGTDFLIKTPDGIQPTLITLPIMGRKYYERFGYVYFPGYEHMFSDQEMTAVGHMLGKVLNVNIPFEHRHYSVGKSAYDEVNRKNDATWRQGENLFNERLKTNFGIASPVIPYSSIVWQ